MLELSDRKIMRFVWNQN